MLSANEMISHSQANGNVQVREMLSVVGFVLGKIKIPKNVATTSLTNCNIRRVSMV